MKSPTILIAHSFGGFVAREVAAELRRKNHDAGLVLIDTLHPMPRRKAILQLYARCCAVFKGGIAQDEPPWHHSSDPHGQAILNSNIQIARNYHAASGDVPTVLIRAIRMPLSQRLLYPRDKGWRGKIDLVKVMDVEGGHADVISDKNAEGCADAILASLPELRERSAIER